MLRRRHKRKPSVTYENYFQTSTNARLLLVKTASTSVRTALAAFTAPAHLAIPRTDTGELAKVGLVCNQKNTLSFTEFELILPAESVTFISVRVVAVFQLQSLILMSA